jgi:uncharacterized protein YqhQ
MAIEKLKLSNYGGQALIEGVLMRGQHYLSAAFRLPDKTIKVESEPLKGVYSKPFFRWPFIRGLLLLWDALGIGMQYLTKSANYQTGENEKIEGFSLTLTILFSLGISIALFFVAPAAFSRWIGGLLNWPPLVINLFEGLIRLIIVIGYIWGVSRLRDIRRVFQYHGSEHKTINTFEAGLPMTLENIKRASTKHPRCGTSFILTVVFISIIVFSLLGKNSLLITISSRIIFLPVIVMLAYEYNRWASARINSPFVRVLFWPNLAIQKITALEPTKDMIEVALAAFTSMESLEAKKKT